MSSTDRQYMKNLNDLIADKGVQFRNMAVSSSSCCPARASMLTGLYTHNHNVTSNIPPYGARA